MFVCILNESRNIHMENDNPLFEAKQVQEKETLIFKWSMKILK